MKQLCPNHFQDVKFSQIQFEKDRFKQTFKKLKKLEKKRTVFHDAEITMH